MSTYKVKVNDTFSFEFEMERVLKADIVQTGIGSFDVLSENIPYQAQLLSSDFYNKSYKVSLKKAAYTVVIENPLDLLIKDMGFENRSIQILDTVKAPMPGLILEIYVAVGQKVLENEPLLVLGAMKMENSFLSPREGVIKAVEVVKGDTVDKGQLLIEFE